MRTFSLFALLTIATVSGATRLSAQCTPQMNISVYSDGDPSADGLTVYGYSSTEDSSTLCSCYHSDYQTTAVLQLADGTYVDNTEAGETSSVSSPTDGDGTYYALGAAGLICSCYGNLGAGGPTITITPPPPVITGIADTLNWSNTLYQGASGYLAIFGTTLIAWGETPTPTVTGDGDITIGSVIYASDGQVNVAYIVSAQAAAGSHTLSLQTARGTARGQVQVAAPCGDQRDAMIGEYVTYSVDLLPTCSSFTQSSPTTNFTFAVLNSGTYAWAILTGYLGSGLDGIFAHEPYAMVITSGYRNPAKANSVNPDSVKTSRHEHGDGVDIATYSNDTQWTSMHDAAKQYGTPGGTPCMEPKSVSTNNHLHVDWRPTNCPASWLL